MDLKAQAAIAALDYVQSGMTVGLGTGSTTSYFIDLLGEKLKRGELKDVRGVPTSESTASRARALKIPLVSLDEVPELDLAVDGADEVDPELNLIKGLGRALLREKIVESHARRFIVIVDESKLVPRLGTKGPLPVELVPFAANAQIRWLNTLGCRAELWLEVDGTPATTDNGNYLAKCWFEAGIEDVHQLAEKLVWRPGIVEHGLFLGMANLVIVAGKEGIRKLEALR
ncbi:MAG: ribose-5-phosphate isomerase RpiA [Anaerolineales bacterium]|nr:ribose-5-phosphate isomerase RpiA [Anaerolineales bacterium]MDW8163034.1 ribose-5-phosphate isomerase RpiA [Anaerolineales bacterium]